MLISQEGLELILYTDSVGIPSIGVGRNLQDVGISESEAMMMLENDMTRVIGEVESSFPWLSHLNDCRQLVIISMVFNLGLQGFKKFKNMIAALEVENYDLAAKEMLLSSWAKQLVTRSNHLASIMRSGTI